jgi:hypothetical protein
MSDIKVTKPLTPAVKHRLDGLVKAHGIGPVSRALGINRTTIARAMAGLDMYGVSRAAIEHGLDAVEALVTAAVQG